MSESTFYWVVIILLAAILLVLLNLVISQRSWLSAFADAMENLEKKARPPNSDIRDLLNTEEYDKVLEVVSARIKDQGEHRTLLWYRGVALYHLKRWDDSRADLEKAIELEPSYEESLRPYLAKMEGRVE